MEQLHANERILRHTGGTFSQALIEGEVSLPVGKPEMARVVLVCGRAETGSVESLDGRAMTDGTLTLCVCYLDGEGNMHAFESVSTFKHTADVPGAQAGMRGTAQAYVSSIETQMTDSRRLNVAAVIELLFEIKDEVDLSYCRPDQTDQLVAKSDTLCLEMRCARATTAAEIKGEAVPPQGQPELGQALFCQGEAVIQNAFAEEDVLCAEGELKLCITYESPDEQAPIGQFFTEIPFSEMLSAPGAKPGQRVLASAKVKDLFARVDEEGESFAVEAVCALEVEAQETMELPVLVDAYAIGQEVELVKEEVQMCSCMVVQRGTAVQREAVSMLDAPPVGRVLATFAMPSCVRSTAQDDGIVMECVLSCVIVYLDRENALRTFETKWPLRMEEELAGMQREMSAQARLWVQQVQAVPSAEGVDLRALLGFEVYGYVQTRMQIVQDVHVHEMEQAPMCGIVVYFASAGDTMWDVAKRYRVRMEDLMRYNPDAQEELEAGQKLILLCRKAG